MHLCATACEIEVRYDSEEEGSTMTLSRINTHLPFDIFGASLPGFRSLSPFGAHIGVSTSSIQTMCNLRKLVSQGAKGSVLVLDSMAKDDVGNSFCNVRSW
jgi:hypothetical protein